MNVEQARKYCRSKRGSIEDFPFDEATLVFKICDKIFALLPLDVVEEHTINLKGNPEENIDLREQYEGIIPGYHMNKAHWITVYLDSDVSDKMIMELIDKSYELVLAKVSVKVKNQYGLN